jgi:hypothetical protein
MTHNHTITHTHIHARFSHDIHRLEGKGTKKSRQLHDKDVKKTKRRNAGANGFAGEQRRDDTATHNTPSAMIKGVMSCHVMSCDDTADRSNFLKIDNVIVMGMCMVNARCTWVGSMRLPSGQGPSSCRAAPSHSPPRNTWCMGPATTHRECINRSSCAS